jgi:hypothetical protein
MADAEEGKGHPPAPPAGASATGIVAVIGMFTLVCCGLAAATLGVANETMGLAQEIKDAQVVATGMGAPPAGVRAARCVHLRPGSGVPAAPHAMYAAEGVQRQRRAHAAPPGPARVPQCMSLARGAARRRRGLAASLWGRHRERSRSANV